MIFTAILLLIIPTYTLITGIEAFILDDYKSIVLEPKEIPVIRVYVGIISNNIAVKINGKYYDAKQLNDKYVYEVELPECAKKGIYQANIFNGSDVLSINNIFEVSKKGMTEVSLFD